jgi:hypothetical protein
MQLFLSIAKDAKDIAKGAKKIAKDIGAVHGLNYPPRALLQKGKDYYLTPIRTSH